MTVTIALDCNNAAFADCDGDELARILHEIAKRYEGRYMIAQTMPLRDLNGNKVGEMTVADATFDQEVSK